MSALPDTLVDDDVAKFLRASVRTLRRMIADTPKTARVPWFVLRAGQRRWLPDVDAIKTWADEVERWRASVRSEAGGKSGGSSPTATPRAGAGSVRAQPPKARGAKSKTPSPAAASGSLVTLVRELTSGK